MQIDTERLILRPIKIADKEDLFAYRSDAETNKYQGFVPKTLTETEEFIKKTARKPDIPDSWFQLAVIEKESKTMIGDIGINFHEENHSQVSLGYTIAKKRQGLGLATEALKQIIHFLFNEMGKNEISLYIDPCNNPSIRVAEKLGFTKTSELVVTIVEGEEVRDRIFRLKKEETDY